MMVAAVASTIQPQVPLPPVAKSDDADAMAPFDAILADLLQKCASAEKAVEQLGSQLQAMNSPDGPPASAASSQASTGGRESTDDVTTETDVAFKETETVPHALASDGETARAVPDYTSGAPEPALDYSAYASNAYSAGAQVLKLANQLFKVEA